MTMVRSDLTFEQRRLIELFDRRRFEEAVEGLKPPFPLGTITINGQFDRYFDPQTQAAWEGWQLGASVAWKFQGRLLRAADLLRQCEVGLRKGFPYEK